MSRDDPQMKLRLPADLRDRIADAAAANGRSMNAEIIQRLEGTFTQATLDRTNLTEEQRRSLGRLESALGEILGSLAVTFAEQNHGRGVRNGGAS